MKLKSWSNNADRWLLTFETEPCWLLRLMGAKPKELEYAGECTTWHTYPDFKSCSTATELWLHGIWDKLRNEERSRMSFARNVSAKIQQDERLDFSLVIRATYQAGTPLMKTASYIFALIQVLQRFAPELGLRYDDLRSKEDLEERTLTIVVTATNVVPGMRDRMAELKSIVRESQELQNKFGAA